MAVSMKQGAKRPSGYLRSRAGRRFLVDLAYAGPQLFLYVLVQLLPFVIALVELEEGVRMLGELRNVDPAGVEIGMPVHATYIDFPEGESGPAWTLYAWEPVA